MKGPACPGTDGLVDLKLKNSVPVLEHNCNEGVQPDLALTALLLSVQAAAI